MASPNGNGKRIISENYFFIAIILALIAGFSAIIAPLQKEVDTLKQDLHEHKGAESHIGTATQLSAIKVMFAEVETQFKKEREAIDLRSIAAEREHLEMKERLKELEQWRIRLLEKK